MFLQPRKTKYKKYRKGRLKAIEFKSNKLKFGLVGLKSASSGVINARQIEAARRTIVRKLQKQGKLWLRIFPDTPVTNKPNESRMGKGKGQVSFWVAKIGKGQVIFEICGVNIKTSVEALKAGSHKLPVKTRTFL